MTDAAQERLLRIGGEIGARQVKPFRKGVGSVEIPQEAFLAALKTTRGGSVGVEPAPPRPA